MSKKLDLRHERTWWDEPPKPESGAYKFRVEHVFSVAERVNHFPGWGRDSFYEWEEDEPESTPEYCGTLPGRESISLKKILDLVKEHNLDPKNVEFTASFSDDYLSIEVVNIRKLNDQEQLEEYKEAYEGWAKTKRLNKEEELKRIEWQMESLKRQAEQLKKNE